MQRAAASSREVLAALRKAEAVGKLETAQRLKIKCSQVFRYAIVTGRADNDPTIALRGALKAPETKHHASPKDPAKIGELLRAIEGYSGNPVTAAALKLSPLLFVRPGELCGARWEEIAFEAAEWRIPAARMKMRTPHLVPLSKQAVKILRELHPLTGSRALVFGNFSGGNNWGGGFGGSMMSNLGMASSVQGFGGFGGSPTGMNNLDVNWLPG